MIIWIVTFIAIVIVAGFILVIVKDRTYFHSPPYTKKSSKPSEVLVVYYSRSGNTEAMAREIARKFDSDIIKIEAEKYSLDFQGWRNAGNDADQKVTEAFIQPETVDLEKYSLIFLGSPIWWYRPAPPLWAFVAKNDFKGVTSGLKTSQNHRFKISHV